MTPRAVAAGATLLVLLGCASALAQGEGAPPSDEAAPELHRALSLWPGAERVAQGHTMGLLRQGTLGPGRTELFAGVGVDGAGRSLYGDAGYAPASAAAVFGARVSFDVARNLEVRLETALQGSATDVGASATAALVWWFSRRVGLQLGVTGYVGTNWERDVFATDPIAEFAREDALIRAMEGEDEGDASDVIRALFLTAVRLVGR